MPKYKKLKILKKQIPRENDENEIILKIEKKIHDSVMKKVISDFKELQNDLKEIIFGMNISNNTSNNYDNLIGNFNITTKQSLSFLNKILRKTFLR